MTDLADAVLTVLPGLSDRWRPTRAGLISLWRYWDETFTFHRGRLLLRGPNGSGKSMALELLLPFLLDADTNPSKLTSAAKSRGGLYDRVMTGSADTGRTGFAWVEFRRGEETFTVGARIRASQNTRKVDVDYFTTTLAVGHELHLLDATRTPLSRKALVEAIGDAGRVHSSGEEHRNAVREALFPGFNADRYTSVIGALLALRKEKLSQNLDLAKLSDTLSESLPPIDDHDIAAVAEGFERLDRRRAELAGLEGELAEVRLLAARQRDYARAVVVGAAGVVRAAETRRDDVTRDERTAREDLDEVEAAARGAASERQALASRIEAIAVEIAALKDSDAYRDGDALADLQEHARQLRRLAGRAAETARTQGIRHDAARQEREDAAGRLATAAANLAQAEQELQAAAERVGGEGVIGEASGLGDADDAERLVHAWVEAQRNLVREVRAALLTHSQAIATRTHLEGQVAGDEATVAARRQARDAARHDETEALATYRAAVQDWAAGCDTIGPGRLAAALPATVDDPSAVTEAVSRLAGDVLAEAAVARRDLDAEHTQARTDRDTLLDERARWAEGGLAAPAGPSWRSPRDGRPGAPLWRLVDLAGAVPAGDVDGLESALAGAGLLDAWVQPDGAVDLADGRADLVLGVHPTPGPSLGDLLVPAADAPETGVSASVVAGVLASIPTVPSLLPPDGSAVGAPGPGRPDGDQAVPVLASGLSGAGAAGPTEVGAPSGDALGAGVSVADPGRPGGAPVVTVPSSGLSGAGAAGPTEVPAPSGGTVASDPDGAARHGATAFGGGSAGSDPGLQPAGVVIGLDGTYRLGAAIGRGPRQSATLLGAVARERHRLARLAELDAAIAAVDAVLAVLARRTADLHRWVSAVAAELAAVPSGEPVEAARRSLASAHARLIEAEARLEASREDLRSAEHGVREALRTLTALAARHRLPSEAEALAAVEAGLTGLDRTAGTWARRRRDVASAERDLRREESRLTEAEQSAAEAEAERARADREAVTLEGRVATLESSIGAEYGEVLRRIGALDAERATAQPRAHQLDKDIPALERKVGVLSGKLAEAEAARAAAEEDRAGAHHRFVSALLALGADAAMASAGPLDTATAVLAEARTVAAAHESVAADPQAVERLSERVRERVHAAQAALGGRVDVSRDLAGEGWWLLRTVVGGIRRGVTELTSALTRELAEGRAELAAEEERLFEQTLAGSVRRALAERIRMANGLVDGINAQLDKVRTIAGGVQVRLRWEVDPDQLDAVKAARTLLLRDPADLSDAERASLQAFVRARVDQARAELEANASWEARLRETLDYRAWHRFSLQLAHRDWEGFQPATARRLQKLSTGERSIALHLPMIASVAAHYAADDGGASACPRLILLDELFAGVDTANRTQLFGTFTEWDLDAVFTSDHEWCQYASLDGIAIHHLHPPTGDEPVTSTRFTWDGRHRRSDPPAA